MTLEICKLIADNPNPLSLNNSFHAEIDDTSKVEVAGFDIKKQIEEDKKYGVFPATNGVITYSLVNYTTDFKKRELNKYLTNFAFTELDAHIQHSLKWTNLASRADMRIEFKPKNADIVFKQFPNTLAWFGFPFGQNKGMGVFNDDYLFSPMGLPISAHEFDPVNYPDPNTKTKIKTYDFPKIMRHELGHGVGLPHSPNPDNVMSSNYSIMSDHYTAEDLTRLWAKYKPQSWKHPKLKARFWNWYYGKKLGL